MKMHHDVVAEVPESSPPSPSRSALRSPPAMSSSRRSDRRRRDLRSRSVARWQSTPSPVGSRGRPGGGRRAAPSRARRRSAGCGGATPTVGSAHGAGERRGPRRRRIVHRVRTARRRGPASSPRARRPHRQHSRRRNVGGIGTINGERFGGHATRCVVASYDYTVLAGTQGTLNHRKKDRLFELAAELRLPVVFFTEGGGGRPGDSEAPGPTGFDCLAFLHVAELSGLVPLVGVNAGYCFAGNAALLGCCDVVIATEDSNIGMGGPAMIEGGGLGVHEADVDRPDRRAACQRRGRHRRCRRGRGGRRSEALPVVLPRSPRRVVVRRAGRPARRRSRGPQAYL